MSQEPYQLMNGPFEVFVSASPVLLAPDIAIASADIDAAWSLLGVDGDKDVTEDGIKVLLDQEISKFRGLGSIAVRKLFRTTQDVAVEFVLADASIENYSRALNGATINLDSHRRLINLLMTSDVEQYSLLVRGDDRSPYGAFNTQWWLPRCSHDAGMETVYVKGEPVGLKYNFVALHDSTYGLGTLESQDETS